MTTWQIFLLQFTMAQCNMSFCRRVVCWNAIIMQEIKHNLQYTFIILKSEMKTKKDAVAIWINSFLYLNAVIFLFHIVVWQIVFMKHHPSPKSHCPKFVWSFRVMIWHQKEFLRMTKAHIHRQQIIISKPVLVIWQSLSSTKQTCLKQRPCLTPPSLWRKVFRSDQTIRDWSQGYS